MKIEGDYVIFNTGSKHYANNGIIGIDQDFNLFGGYDGCFENDSDLTNVEKHELANYMIKQWSEFSRRSY